jgi:hypothetical protein
MLVCLTVVVAVVAVPFTLRAFDTDPGITATVLLSLPLSLLIFLVLL